MKDVENSVRTPCRYRIIANPVSGGLTGNKRYGLLKGVASMLQAEVHGLDTRSEDELRRCAYEQADQCDVLVVAGGDGTMSMVINAVELPATTLAFIPLGTGNALARALGYHGRLSAIARRVRNGTTHTYDLIDCDSRRKAFMASLGIDGEILKHYDQRKSSGHRGLTAYISAGLRAFFREYRPVNGSVELDGDMHHVKRLLSAMVLKQPYFGMGLKVVPQARWDDGLLHQLTIMSGLPRILAGLVSGFTIGNRVGDYRCGKRVRISLDRPLTLQIDGELAWTDDHFTFGLLPGVLRMKH
jgi:diacylglycerol kinase family enzyme